MRARVQIWMGREDFVALRRYLDAVLPDDEHTDPFLALVSALDEAATNNENAGEGERRER